MRLESRKYLHDMERASEALARFTADKTFAEFAADDLLRSAVERQFEITGEALSQLARVAPEVAGRVTDHRRIIAFRNILIHGYAEVDDRLVWGVLARNLPLLRREVAALLAEAEPSS